MTVALLCLGQIPLSTEAQLPTGEKVNISADQLLYDAAKQVVVVRGHTRLSTDKLVLRADEIVYDQAAEKATAKGNVMFVSGLLAAVADEVNVDIKSLEANVKGGLFMQKKGVAPEALLQAKTPDELRLMGETVALITGTRIKRTGDNSFLVDDLAFTPCQCEPGEPSWRVEAKRAEVELGEKAILTWPVVYVRSVPIFALPWLYLPIAERRSGLLVPRPAVTSLNGFSIDQPLFITLGRSYDMTVTPGYYRGSRGDNGLPPPPFGIMGPRLQTEFRYAPSEQTSGRVNLGLIYDFKWRRNPLDDRYFFLPGAPESEPIREARGLRGELSIQHNQDLGRGFYNRLDLGMVSDGYYTRDLTADLVARENQYLRTSGTLFHRGDDHYAGLDVSIRQDIRAPYSFFGTDVAPEGVDLGGRALTPPRTFQRLPGLTFSLPERLLAGPLSGSLRMEFTRLAPLNGGFGDEGADGIYDPRSLWDPSFTTQGMPPPGTAPTYDLLQNGFFDGLDREARDRLDLMPRVGASFGVGNFARLSPSLAVRQDFYLGEQTGRAAQRGYPLASLVLESELSRPFKTRFAELRHSFAPSVEMRYVPLVWGGVPGPGASPDANGRCGGTTLAPTEALPEGPPTGQCYDEVDAAIPATARGQSGHLLHGVAEVSQKLLYRKQGGGAREVLRADLGQGFDLSRYAPALSGADTPVEGSILRDTYARLAARVGVFRATGIIRFDPVATRITQLSTGFSIDDGRGDALYANYDRLLVTGSDALRRGIDTLVGPRVAPSIVNEADPAEQVVAGLRTNLPFGLRIRYEAIVQPLLDNLPLVQQLFGLSYGPACECWRIEGTAILRRQQLPDKDATLLFPDFGVNLSVSGFGSFGN